MTAFALAAASGGLVFGGVGVAGASNTEVTAVGSFTTYQLMHDLFPTSVNNINPNALTGSQTETIVSDPQTCLNGISYTAGGTQPPNGSGQGKSALAAEETAAATAQGCIDFARSSSAPAPHSETLQNATENGDPSPSHLDYYAYGLDGVDVLVGKNAMPAANNNTQNLESPVELTLQQIQNIYSCWDPSTSTPVTTWAQAGVGTSTDTIVRYWPQAGSGTRAVYTDVLGFDPTILTGINHCGAVPISTLGTPSTPNEENSEDGIIYNNATDSGNTNNHDLNDAIYVYSAGKYSQEFNDSADYNATANNVVDQALTGNTNTMGNFNPSLVLAQVKNSSTNQPAPFVTYTVQSSGVFNPNTNRGTEAINTQTVSEPNEWYSHLPSNANGHPSGSTAAVPGIRYIYNVADTVLPGYNGAKALIGFDNQAQGTASALCRGDDATTIIADGFVPLGGNTNAPAGSDQANVDCREFLGLGYPGQGGSTSWTTGPWPQPQS